MAMALIILPMGPLLGWKRGDLIGALQRLAWAAGLSLLFALVAWGLFQPRQALTAGGLALGAWLVLGALAELAERIRLFGKRTPGELGRRTRALPLAAWGMTAAHAGLGLFVLGAVVETGLKVEAARPLEVGQTIAAGPYQATLQSVEIVEGPNYLAERATLEIVPLGGGRPETVRAEKRFFPAGGQTTTEVGLSFHGLDDVYMVLGERRLSEAGERAWMIRMNWNPWARLIFLGPALMALGGLLSLMDRRLRTADTGRRRRLAA
jgi:cytochrome c-type biogenesis protein CcmF